MHLKKMQILDLDRFEFWENKLCTFNAQLKIYYFFLLKLASSEQTSHKCIGEYNVAHCVMTTFENSNV